MHACSGWGTCLKTSSSQNCLNLPLTGRQAPVTKWPPLIWTAGDLDTHGASPPHSPYTPPSTMPLESTTHAFLLPQVFWDQGLGIRKWDTRIPPCLSLWDVPACLCSGRLTQEAELHVA